MPASQAAMAFLSVSGEYWSAAGSSALSRSGHVVFEFSSTSVRFQPLWANVVWELLELNIEGERDRILSSVLGFVSTLPETNVTWGTSGPALPFDVLYRLWLLRKKVRRWCCSFIIWAAAWGSISGILQGVRGNAFNLGSVSGTGAVLSMLGASMPNCALVGAA